jgi:hypothetical protein
MQIPNLWIFFYSSGSAPPPPVAVTTPMAIRSDLPALELTGALVLGS